MSSSGGHAEPVNRVLLAAAIVVVAILVGGGIVASRWATSGDSRSTAAGGSDSAASSTAPSATPSAGSPTPTPAHASSPAASIAVAPPRTATDPNTATDPRTATGPNTATDPSTATAPAPTTAGSSRPSRTRSHAKPRPAPRPAPRPTPRPVAQWPRSQPPASQITVNFSGDILGHGHILDQARQDSDGSGYYFGRMFSGVQQVIRSSDLAICHQETVISGPGDNDVQGYPSFIAPHELAAAERAAGWDACDTASNHTADHGQDGVDTTLDALDAADVRHTGSYRSAAAAQKATVYDVRGVLVGHIAVTYGLNDGTPPHPFTVNLIDVDKIHAEAHRLKQAGVDIVVVSVHDGQEQDQTPTDEQVSVDARIMASPDVDLVAGAHAHVVQPIKRLPDGRYIVYGLGNLLAMQSWTSDDEAPPNRDGVIVIPTFTRGTDGRYRVTQLGYVPTFVRYDDNRAVLAPARSRARVREILNTYGAPVSDLTDQIR